MPSKPPDGLLEPDALKGARPVLRGEGSRDALPPTRLSTTNGTTARTITTKSGMLLPATIDQQTDFNLITTAIAMYYKRSGCLGSFATAVAVADAMRDSSAVVVLYVGLDGGQDARVLWPNSITFTKENKVVARCYCTMRREWKTFRIDRMLTCHALTTPDDCETAA